MKNECTIKQMRFYGLNKILVDELGRNTCSVINDIVTESIKKGMFNDILNKYFLPEKSNSILEKLDKNLSVKKVLKNEPIKKIESRKNDQEVTTTLEIGAKGFNI